MVPFRHPYGALCVAAALGLCAARLAARESAEAREPSEAASPSEPSAPREAKASPAKGPPWRVPIVFHVAQREGEPVAPPAFLAEQLAAARSIYGPLGVELVEHGRVPLGAEHAELVTRADRDALLPYVRWGEIHCFIVERLMDVDEPGRERRGVHWRPRPAPERSFVVVSQISKPYVLAHELGHWFGNREHSAVPGNLMSYTRTEQPPFLDAAQIRRVRVTLAAMLKSGKLVALPPEQTEPR